ARPTAGRRAGTAPRAARGQPASACFSGAAARPSSPGCPAVRERAPSEGLDSSARSSGGFLGHDVTMCAGWALKNPSCRAAVEGRAQKVALLALCAPAKYENVDPLHGYTL